MVTGPRTTPAAPQPMQRNRDAWTSRCPQLNRLPQKRDLGHSLGICALGRKTRFMLSNVYLLWQRFSDNPSTGGASRALTTIVAS